MLRIVPIVEGHGEVPAVRILLDRIWYEVVHGNALDILRPIRRPKSEFVRTQAGMPDPRVNEDKLARAGQLAANMLASKRSGGWRELILILIDADEFCPAEVAPQICASIRNAVGEIDCVCILAKKEYETWFVGAAESLQKFLNLGSEVAIPSAPEESGSGKNWIAERINRASYSETVDQPSMTKKMNLNQCRERCPSFDKLCRELERRGDSTPGK
jgi:hypothetical protein